MKRIATAILIALAAVAGCKKNVTDYVVHHYVTRIKADTLVDHRNAWCLSPGNPKPAIGSDVADDYCNWTNPTPTVHP